MHLLFFGADDLARSLYRDRSSKQALDFASKLRAYRSQLEKDLNFAPPDVRERMGIELRCQVPGISWAVPPEEIYAAIDITANWFDKVGRLGFGVRQSERKKRRALVPDGYGKEPAA